MRKLSPFLLFFFSLSLSPLLADEVKASPVEKEKEEEKGFFANLDESMNSSFQPVSDFIDETVFYSIPVATDKNGKSVKMPWVLGWLAIAAIVITIYFKFLNFRSKCPLISTFDNFSY